MKRARRSAELPESINEDRRKQKKSSKTISEVEGGNSKTIDEQQQQVETLKINAEEEAKDAPNDNEESIAAVNSTQQILEATNDETEITSQDSAADDESDKDLETRKRRGSDRRKRKRGGKVSEDENEAGDSCEEMTAAQAIVAKKNKQPVKKSHYNFKEDRPQIRELATRTKQELHKASCHLQQAVLHKIIKNLYVKHDKDYVDVQFSNGYYAAGIIRVIINVYHESNRSNHLRLWHDGAEEIPSDYERVLWLLCMSRKGEAKTKATTRKSAVKSDDERSEPQISEVEEENADSEGAVVNKHDRPGRVRRSRLPMLQQRRVAVAAKSKPRLSGMGLKEQKKNLKDSEESIVTRRHRKSNASANHGKENKRDDGDSNDDDEDDDSYSDVSESSSSTSSASSAVAETDSSSSDEVEEISELVDESPKSKNECGKEKPVAGKRKTRSRKSSSEELLQTGCGDNDEKSEEVDSTSVVKEDLRQELIQKALGVEETPDQQPEDMAEDKRTLVDDEQTRILREQHGANTRGVKYEDTWDPATRSLLWFSQARDLSSQISDQIVKDFRSGIADVVLAARSTADKRWIILGAPIEIKPYKYSELIMRRNEIAVSTVRKGIKLGKLILHLPSLKSKSLKPLCSEADKAKYEGQKIGKVTYDGLDQEDIEERRKIRLGDMSLASAAESTDRLTSELNAILSEHRMVTASKISKFCPMDCCKYCSWRPPRLWFKFEEKDMEIFNQIFLANKDAELVVPVGRVKKKKKIRQETEKAQSTLDCFLTKRTDSK